MTDTQKQDRIGEMMREYREESRRQAHAAAKVRESERDQQAALIASQAKRIAELEELVADAAQELEWALNRIDRAAMHRAEEGDGVLYRFVSAKAFLHRARATLKGETP